MKQSVVELQLSNTCDRLNGITPSSARHEQSKGPTYDTKIGTPYLLQLYKCNYH